MKLPYPKQCGTGMKTDMVTYRIDKEPRKKLFHIQSNDFQQGHQYHSMGKGQSFQQMVLGKLDLYMLKNEIGSLPNTIYKN